MGMNEIRHRSVATVQALEAVGAIDHDVLLSRAAEVQGALQKLGELEHGDLNYRLTMHTGPHAGDIVVVAAEVQRLGFAIERVQQR